MSKNSVLLLVDLIYGCSFACLAAASSLDDDDIWGGIRRLFHLSLDPPLRDGRTDFALKAFFRVEHQDVIAPSVSNSHTTTE